MIQVLGRKKKRKKSFFVLKKYIVLRHFLLVKGEISIHVGAKKGRVRPHAVSQIRGGERWHKADANHLRILSLQNCGKNRGRGFAFTCYALPDTYMGNTPQLS